MRRNQTTWGISAIDRCQKWRSSMTLQGMAAAIMRARLYLEQPWSDFCCHCWNSVFPTTNMTYIPCTARSCILEMRPSRRVDCRASMSWKHLIDDDSIRDLNTNNSDGPRIRATKKALEVLIALLYAYDTTPIRRVRHIGLQQTKSSI